MMDSTVTRGIYSESNLVWLLDGIELTGMVKTMLQQARGLMEPMIES